MTKIEEYGYPCKANQSTYCDRHNVTGEWRMKKCRTPTKEKKKKCKCITTADGNSTMKMSKRDKNNLKLRCKKKFIHFQTLATEYALSEVGTYISRALMDNKKRKGRGGMRHRRSLLRKNKKERRRRGAKSQKVRTKTLRARPKPRKPTLPFRAVRYRELFSFESCRQYAKDQRKQCTYFVRVLRGYIKKLHFNVRKDISGAMNRITNRIDKDIYKQCLEVLRPPCTCPKETTTQGQTGHDEPRQIGSKTQNVSLGDGESDEADTPPRKVKRRKRPKGASRNCASVNTNATVTGMTCFRLDHNKWVTPPTWTGDERCYCTNSNNNTYWCMRVINETSDDLYCVFVTNFIEYYDMKTDPNQLTNVYSEQPIDKISILHNDLKRLSKCNGSTGNTSCHIPSGGFNSLSSNTDGGDNFCGQKSTSQSNYDQLGVDDGGYDGDHGDEDVERDDPDEEWVPSENVDENDEDEENNESLEDLLDTTNDGPDAIPEIGDRWKGYFTKPSLGNVSPRQDIRTDSETAISE